MVARAHYEPVIYPMLRAALARVRGTPAEKDFLERMDDLLQNPALSYRPLPQALKFHQSPARFRWALGGNRSSKSFSLGVEVAWYAQGIHPFRHIEVPNIGWYSTISYELVGTILLPRMQELLAETPHKITWRSRGHGIPGAILVDVGARMSRRGSANNPSMIVFKAYEQGREMFQGVDRRYIANDEQFPQDVYVEQVSRIGTNPLDFMAAMTPVDPQPWLETRLTLEVPANWEVFEYPLDDNRESVGGFLKDEEIDAVIAEWPEEIQPTRRQGKWASFLGAVYKTFNRAVHVVSEEEEQRVYFPQGQKSISQLSLIGGIDWGGANPFVFLLAAQIPWLDDDWYIFDEYYWDYRAKGGRLISQHAEEIRAMVKKWQGFLHRVWADHDAQDRQEMAACGIPTHPAAKSLRPTHSTGPDTTVGPGGGSGIETVQTLLKVSPYSGRARFRIARRCKKTIEQMAAYHWPQGGEHRDPTDVPEKKDDHCADVVRYILHSERSRRVKPAKVTLAGRFKTEF